jgi:hypothetical protein
VKRLLCPSAENPFTVIRITEEGKPAEDYNVEPIGSDFGRAFAVTKLGSEQPPYHVLLEREGGTCECKGYLRWHHCRHLESLTALINNEKL